MSVTLDGHLAFAREAIIESNPQKALEHIEAFGQAAEDTPPESEEEKERLRALVDELSQLAMAAHAGARAAAERVQEIIRSATNLQVYNALGERLETSIVAKVPKRF